MAQLSFEQALVIIRGIVREAKAQQLKDMAFDRAMESLRNALAMDEDWITVHPNGREHKGQPVLVDGEGSNRRVVGGMGGKFNGMTMGQIRQISQAKKSAKQPAQPVQIQTQVQPTPRSVPSSAQPAQPKNSAQRPVSAGVTPEGRKTAQLLQQHPFTRGKTTGEYQAMMQAWMPGKRILLGDMPAQNAEGTAAAVHDILSRYPELEKEFVGVGLLGEIHRRIPEETQKLAQDSILAKDGAFRAEYAPSVQRELDYYEKTRKYGGDWDSYREMLVIANVPVAEKSQQEFETWKKMNIEERKAWAIPFMTEGMYKTWAKQRLTVGLYNDREKMAAVYDYRQGVMISNKFLDASWVTDTYRSNTQQGWLVAGE